MRTNSAIQALAIASAIILALAPAALAGTDKIVLAHLEEESVPAAENPGAPTFDTNEPASTPSPSADWERVPPGTAPTSSAVSSPTAPAGGSPPSSVTSGPAANAASPTGAGATAPETDAPTANAANATASSAAAAAVPAANAASSTGSGATASNAGESGAASGTGRGRTTAAAFVPTKSAPGTTASATGGTTTAIAGVQKVSAIANISAGAASGQTGSGNTAPDVAGEEDANAGPPPALDLSTMQSVPDLAEASLAGEIKTADTPARAAALRVTEQARVGLAAGQTDSALRDLGRAVSIDPGNPFGYFYLGRAYIARHNYAQALTFFKRAEIGFAARPDWLGETVAFEGVCYEELGQTTEAALAYKRAVGSAPNNLMARVGFSRRSDDLPPPAATTEASSEPSANTPPGEALPPPENSAPEPAPVEAAPPPPPTSIVPDNGSNGSPAGSIQPNGDQPD